MSPLDSGQREIIVSGVRCSMEGLAYSGCSAGQAQSSRRFQLRGDEARKLSIKSNGVGLVQLAHLH